jgi:hypothetical protein
MEFACQDCRICAASGCAPGVCGIHHSEDIGDLTLRIKSAIVEGQAARLEATIRNLARRYFGVPGYAMDKPWMFRLWLLAHACSINRIHQEGKVHALYLFARHGRAVGGIWVDPIKLSIEGQVL